MQKAIASQSRASHPPAHPPAQYPVLDAVLTIPNDNLTKKRGGGGGQGYTTTTLPTTWVNDSSKILCAFEHVSLLEGTMVLISEDAPVCCCPRAFSQKDQFGEMKIRLWYLDVVSSRAELWRVRNSDDNIATFLLSLLTASTLVLEVDINVVSACGRCPSWRPLF